MPLPADTDVSTPKYLRDKYAIVGVGETTYTRGSARQAVAVSAGVRGFARIFSSYQRRPAIDL